MAPPPTISSRLQDAQQRLRLISRKEWTNRNGNDDTTFTLKNIMQNRSYLKRSRRQGKAGTACCHHWPQDGVRLFLPNGGHCKGATVDEFHRSFLPDFSLKSPSAYMWKCRATMRKSSPEKRITIRSWVSMNVHSFASGSRTRLTVLGAIGPQKVEQGQSQQRQSVHALAQQVLELVFVLEQLEHVAHLRVTLK